MFIVADKDFFAKLQATSLLVGKNGRHCWVSMSQIAGYCQISFFKKNDGTFKAGDTYIFEEKAHDFEYLPASSSRDLLDNGGHSRNPKEKVT